MRQGSQFLTGLVALRVKVPRREEITRNILSSYTLLVLPPPELIVHIGAELKVLRGRQPHELVACAGRVGRVAEVHLRRQELLKGIVVL